MANQIRMSPDQMRIRAGEYTTQAGVVEDVVKKLDELLTALQSEWEGSASESYAAKYGELRPGFVKAQSLITDIAAALTKTAQIVEDADSNIANAFKS